MITPHVVQPEGIKEQLFPHQLVAIAKMEERERDKQVMAFHYQIDLSMGIYADLAGYGKTLTMIGLMIRDRMVWDPQEDYIQSSIINVYGNGCIVKHSRTFFKRIGANLVVASTTVMRQWVTELRDAALRYVLVTNRKMCMHIEPSEYDVVVLTPLCYNWMMDRFPNYAWKRFIYDDPTHCKIPSMRAIVAGYIWMLSATPEMLLYQYRSSNHFMSSIFCSYLDYNIYKHLIIKNTDEFVRNSYALPPLEEHVHICHEPVVWIIRDLICPMIIDMISAGNVQGAIRAMGGTSTSNLYELVLREKQEALRHAEWKISKFQRMHDYTKSEKWTMKRAQIEEELRQLNYRLARVIQEDKCHICFENLCEPVVLTCCQNIFCGRCILRWISTNTNLQSVCPLCRRSLTSEHLVHIRSPTPSMDSQEETEDIGVGTGSSDRQGVLSKIDMLKHILLSQPVFEGTAQNQFIIFSSYNETFHRIRQMLRDMNIEYGEPHGRAEARNRIMENFRNGHFPILFLNCIEYGAGEHLPQATDLILFHDMNDNMKTQIIGRAYRIGRTTPLRVHYLRTDTHPTPCRTTTTADPPTPAS